MQNKPEQIQLNDHIRHYPTQRLDPTNLTFVLGDLHGNAMKLIYLLLRLGIIDLPDAASFHELWAIYDQDPKHLTLENLNRFEAIIHQATVQQPGLLVCLGDEFADRGKNDYFTALVFNKLHEANVPYRILLSNHGIRLLYYIETGRRNERLHAGQEASLDNLIVLKTKFPELQTKIRALFSDPYTHHLDLIGYTQPEGEPLHLMTHAPIDHLMLAPLGQCMNVPYDENFSTENFIHWIDAINDAFQRMLRTKDVSKNLVDPLPSTGAAIAVVPTRAPYLTYAESETVSIGTYLAQSVQRHPVYELIWNRFPARMPLPLGCIDLHGHVGPADSSALPDPGYINMDSHWGKPSETVTHSKTKRSYTIPADDQSVSQVFCAPVTARDIASRYYVEARRIGFEIMQARMVALASSPTCMFNTQRANKKPRLMSPAVSPTTPTPEPPRPPPEASTAAEDVLDFDVTPERPSPFSGSGIA